MSRHRRVAAEGIGSAALLAGVVGSGVMAARLAGGNDALALLVNAAATAALLYVLIATLRPLSGAHFNPAVSLLFWLRGELPGRDLAAYVAAQCVGAIGGVLVAHALFDLPLLQLGSTSRHGVGQWLSEVVATGGLLLTIVGNLQHDSDKVASRVAAFVFAAYWFTASTAFANPAVTVARAFTDTYCGIAPTDVPDFIAAQGVATVMLAALLRRSARHAS